MARSERKKRAPTMADVARLAQVSTQTVSRVLNGYEFIRPETREQVIEAVRQLDYRPNVAARALVTRRSRTIGVVATDYHSFGPAAALSSIETAARAAGYGISIMSLPKSDSASVAAALRDLVGQSVDGIVTIAPQDLASRTSMVSVGSVPVVTFDSVDTGGEMSVTLDSAEGSRIATSHLIELGHRGIAHLAGAPALGVSGSRIEGWRRALSAAGLPAPEPLIGDWTARSGYQLAQTLAADRAITGIVAANDRMAQGALLALHEAGRDVPGDVSVTGFDDEPEAAYFIPPLTTVRQDFELLGQRCIRAIVARIDGEPPLRFDPIVPDLVIRASTGPAPARC